MVYNHILQLPFYFQFFHEYFGDDDMSTFDWIRNPFECLLTELTVREQEELANCHLTGICTYSSTVCHCNPSGNHVRKSIHHCLPKLSMFCRNFQWLTCVKQHFLQLLQWNPYIEQNWTLKMTYTCVSCIGPRLDILCGAKQAHCPNWHWLKSIINLTKRHCWYWWFVVSVISPSLVVV